MFFISLFKIFGHSMEPNFKMNQSVLVSGLPYLFKKPKIGDVIVFRDSKSDKRILKRIMKISSSMYLVGGDNKQDSKDFGWIEKKDIYGKVVLTV